MNYQNKLAIGVLALATMACGESALEFQAFESSAAGNSWTAVSATEEASSVSIKLNTSETFQTITGFGGAFTESSAYLLNKLGPENRKKVIDAYFGSDGAAYSLTRAHINSSDFSLGNYAYVEDGDESLETFSIAEDMDDVVPFIKDAMATSDEGFKI